MNVEDLRYYCLSLPQVEERMRFGDDTLCFCVVYNIFCWLLWIVLIL